MLSANPFGNLYNADNEALLLNNRNLHVHHKKYLAYIYNLYPNLRVLNLSHNQLQEAGKYLRSILQHKPSLCELNLASNALLKKDINQISYGMINHPNLNSLDLSNNTLGNQGGEYIADGVWGCPTLKKLKLSNCGLGKNAIEALVFIIRKHSNLIYLDLMNNQIDDDGAGLIAKALAEGLFNPGLIIRLDNNKISSSGELALSDILESKRLPTGLRITLQNNFLTHESWDRIENASKIYRESIIAKQTMFFQALHQPTAPISILPREILNIVLRHSTLFIPKDSISITEISDNIKKIIPEYFVRRKIE